MLSVGYERDVFFSVHSLAPLLCDINDMSIGAKPSSRAMYVRELLMYIKRHEFIIPLIQKYCKQKTAGTYHKIHSGC